MQRLADDFGVAAGLTVSYLEPALAAIENTLTLDPGKRFHLPNRLELALKIEQEIHRMLKHPEPLFRPLMEYLEGKERRIVNLADELAGCFQNYDRYGSAMLQEWQGQVTKGWQEALWKKVVGMTTAMQRREWKETESAIHLFSISFLSKQQHRFLMELSTQHPVYYYLLSPCESFWSDILSDREGIRLQKAWQKQGMLQEDLLFDRNPLLANWGKLGRKMAAEMEETLSQVEEDYEFPEENLTLIEAVQRDLLQLRNPKKESPLSLAGDSSLQVHAAPTKMREVEILYNALLREMEKGTVSPSDIIVMAPDIMAYEPYIRAVFHSAESLLDCQIMDLSMLSQNEWMEGFFHLLNLTTGRWDAVSLLKLLEYPSFQKKQRLTEEDRAVIRSWVEKTNIRWGDDLAHRLELLRQSHCPDPLLDLSPTGTWQEGFDRLLLGMAMLPPEDEELQSRYAPVQDIPSTQQELLGQWIFLVRTLKCDLEPLRQEKSLIEWSATLEKLLGTYFTVKEEDKRELAELIGAFHRIGETVTELFPFETVKFHLEAAVNRKRVCYRESHLHAVKFCSMLPMRAVPAKIVALLGMGEGEFPRRDTMHSLNLLATHPKADYYPTTTDFDRYLFLETLLSTRQCFILTYSPPSSQESKEQAPSLVLSELLSYLDSGYLIEGRLPSAYCTYKHPFQSFDSSYFERGALFPSFSMLHYKAAVSFYRTEKNDRHRFIPSFKPIRVPEPASCIELKQLAKLASDPLKLYFNQTLGIYLNTETESLKTEEDFLLSFMDRAQLRKQALRIPIEALLFNAQQQGKFPSGPFKGAIVADTVEETQAEFFKEWGATPGMVFDIHLSPLEEKPRYENGSWYVPPLEIGQTRLVGQLKGICPEGKLVYAKHDKTDIIKVWPEYLVYLLVIEKYAIAAGNRLLFMKDGKTKAPWFASAEKLLKTYLAYYEMAQKNPSPLIPEWALAFAEGDQSKLQSKIKGCFAPRALFYNHYAKWLERSDAFSDTAALLAQWQPTAQEVYGELFAKWK